MDDLAELAVVLLILFIIAPKLMTVLTFILLF